MAGNEDKIQSGFKRQRRNLILVSIVVFFVEISGVELSKINVFGNEFKISDPFYVYVGLWVWLVYLLVRYYGYFHDLGEKGFKKSFYERLQKKAYKKFQRKILRGTDFSEDEKKAFYKGFVEKKASSTDEIALIETRKDGFILWYHSLKCYEAGIDFKEKRGSGRRTYSKRVKLEGHELYAPIFRSIVYALFNTIYFSEYILPYIIFMIPAAYKIHLLIS